jgi:hypothetical protein
MSEIETRIEELNDQPRKYREEEKTFVGAIVSLETILSRPRPGRGQKESAGRKV